MTQLPDIVSESTPVASPSRPLEDNNTVFIFYNVYLIMITPIGCVF